MWKYLMSPRLYAIYRQKEVVLYQPTKLELWSDRIISTAYSVLKLGMYTSPFICMYLYRCCFTLNQITSLSKLVGSVGCVMLLTSFVARAYFRANNPMYVEFLQVLQNKPSPDYMANIRKYDFEFSAWPVSFKMPKTESPSSLASPFGRSANAELSAGFRLATQILAYIAVNTFALRLIYPGSLGLIHNLMWSHLIEGRAELVQNHKGKRSKVITADGNVIDTMFVDKRVKTANHNILVICCEGNSGFYEVGIMTVPIKAGYSALGWNHPGFAGSSGLPYPGQEHNAIDAVLQFATKELNFRMENIVMYGWSIGGYSAAWAARNYSLKGMILDATFDDLLPLAEKNMPASWAPLVKEVVRSHVDLHVAELVKDFNGVVHIVRRTEDEIICLEQGNLGTNRGNFLAVELIKHRYPDMSLVHALEDYAKMPADRRPEADRPGLSKAEKRAIQLLTRFTSDYHSSHCTMLPPEMFATIMRQHFDSTEGPALISS